MGGLLRQNLCCDLPDTNRDSDLEFRVWVPEPSDNRGPDFTRSRVQGSGFRFCVWCLAFRVKGSPKGLRSLCQTLKLQNQKPPSIIPIKDW